MRVILPVKFKMSLKKSSLFLKIHILKSNKNQRIAWLPTKISFLKLKNKRKYMHFSTISFPK